MNEWGIPDWQDAAAYGDTEKWDIDRWRWEFVRRRSDVRQAFDESCQESYELDLKWSERPGVRPYRPDEPGFVAGCQLAIDLGYHGLPNPRIGEQDEFVLLNANGDDRIMRGHKRVREIETLEQVVFDLSKPIRPQIETVESYLKEQQRNVVGKSLQKRRHTAKWLTYLRVLDGREAGASWSEIAQILMHTAATEQTARDIHEQARALCFNF